MSYVPTVPSKTQNKKQVSFNLRESAAADRRKKADGEDSFIYARIRSGQTCHARPQPALPDSNLDNKPSEFFPGQDTRNAIRLMWVSNPYRHH